MKQTARLIVVVAAMACAGCAFIQPTSKGAPIADTVGTVIFAGSTTIAIAEMDTKNGHPDFSKDTGYTAGVFTLVGVALVYAFSAMYGFSQEPCTQTSDEPILGLQILALGLAGFGSGFKQGAGPPPATVTVCTNDYECGGPGNVCIKPAGQFSGRCGTSVNAYGVQQFDGQSPNSVGPGQRSCNSATDCAVGFTCDQGNCVK